MDDKGHEHNADQPAVDELKLPEDRVEDLEPDDQDAAEVKGGAADIELKHQ